jgi:uncharacterized protein YndB with AHSA1/START domain
MARNNRIQAEIEVRADPSATYRMFTNSTLRREWLADEALARPIKDGRIYLAWSDGYQTAGKFRKLEPDRSIRFSWIGTDEKSPTDVKVTLRPIEKGTRVRVTQSGFEDSKSGRKSASDLKAAWESSLENLASVMQDGPDLRITRRPMLGVLLEDEIRSESAAQVGVDHGIRVSSTIEGMGAQKAGLTSGDVIVGLGGKTVRSFADLVVAVSTHRAGDEVEVEFYRNGQPHTASMELSGRQVPDLPDSGPGLAAFVGAIYRRFHDNLVATVEGSTEEEASQSPAESEWSVREILAHLITGEVDAHSQLIEQVEGLERLYDGGGGNSHLRMRISAASYPDTWAMIDAYKRAMAETVGLLDALPADLRRPAFWRIAFGYSDAESHLNEHLEQIKAARAASSQAS